MRRPVYLVAALLAALALGLLAAACGDDNGSQEDGSGQTAAPTQSAPSPAASPTTAPPTATQPAGGGGGGGAAAVTIQGFQFQPATITVSVGTTVTWTNRDGAPHTVTADQGSAFNSGSLSSGGTFQHTFSQAGRFSYHCDLHPSMTGTVVVQ